MRIAHNISLPSIFAIAIVAAAAAVGAPGCRRDKKVVDGKVTGIHLTVRYDTKLQLSQMAITGSVDEVAAFTPGSLPERPRPLTSGSETAVILVPAALDGKTVVLRVDGRAGAMVMGSEQQLV
ncbi:MAG: hypothetical protein H7X95_12250, partial [Deltaproteobacteria bacterium]|nr:hypothetical protein [Deltaproteobacteria bacterium]